MTTYLEDLVRDAQERQADRAVPAERILAQLAARTARRAQSRRRGALMVATACAAALAIVAVPVTLRLDTPAETPPAAAPGWSGVVPDFAHLKPVREVWPHAVHRLPATLPDGTGYFPYARLGRDRYLVRSLKPDASPESDTGPMIFDTKAGTVWPLGVAAAQGADGTWLQDITVLGDRALWVLQQGASQFEVWGAPLDGKGKGRLLTRWTGPGIAYPIGFHADGVYWAPSVQAPATGIYRTPLTGGAPELVPDSAGFREYGRFPWVTTDPRIKPGSVAAPGEPGPRSGELLNLVTGERRPWTANAAAAAVECGPVLCLGRSTDGRAVLQRLDGGAFTKLPYHQSVMWTEDTALDGRFGVGTIHAVNGVSWVWDRSTDTAATIRPGQRFAEVGGGSIPDTLVPWREPDGTVGVLDLTAIK